MKIVVTRDSVCAADDFDPPHARTITVPAAEIGEALVAAVLRAYPLPGIAGGKATWCLASTVPIAVVAQQWSQPKMLSSLPHRLSTSDADDIVKLHFSYLCQVDPDVAVEVLRNLRLISA